MTQNLVNTFGRLLLVVFLTAHFASTHGASLKFSDCQPYFDITVAHGGECGFISLPLRHAGDGSKTLDIFVTRIPAIRANRAPPIFFVAGGPGQASSDLAQRFRYQFAELLVDHDFIFVDQRGTGRSHSLNCDINFLSTLALSHEAQIMYARDAHRACVNNYSLDLGAFSTPEAVRDLNAVRDALGYSEVFVWGGSYGSRVALDYMRRFPEFLAGVILDGVAPIDIQLPFNSARDANLAFEKILQACVAQAACHDAFPTLASDWTTLLRKLRSAPQKLALVHPRTQLPVEVYIDSIMVSTWVQGLMYSRELIPLLPMALHSATTGDFGQLFSLYALGFEDIAKNMSEGMQMAVLCAEDRQHQRRYPAKEKSFNVLLDLASVTAFIQICELYPQGEIDEVYFRATTSDIPSLLLSGRFDPATPPHWADLQAQRLTQSRHIVVPGGHHIVSGLGCLPRIIQQFVSDPHNLAAIDDSCTNTIQTAHFFTDSAGPIMRKNTNHLELGRD